MSHHANRCDAAIANCIEAANEIKRLRQDNAQLQYALEQSEAAHMVPNDKGQRTRTSATSNVSAAPACWQAHGDSNGNT